MLNMAGFVNREIASTVATRIDVESQYVNGIPQKTEIERGRFLVVAQPATSKQIDFLQSGGERIIEALNLYVNTGDMASIKNGDKFKLSDRDGQFKVAAKDYRPARNYCKITVSRLDDK